MQALLLDLISEHNGLRAALNALLDNLPNLDPPSYVEVKTGDDVITELLVTEPFNKSHIKTTGIVVDKLVITILFTDGTYISVKSGFLNTAENAEFGDCGIEMTGESVQDAIINESLTPNLALVVSESYVITVDEDEIEHETNKKSNFYIVKFS